MNSSIPGFESGKSKEPQTTYHRLQTKADGSSNLPGAIFFKEVIRSSYDTKKAKTSIRC